MSYDLKEIKILGYTTDFNQCECCGRENLKGTVSILDLSTDVVLHFGTSCAVNADKYDTLDAFKKAKREINSLKNDIKNHKIFSWQMCRRFKIAADKIDAVESAYLNFMSIAENRLKRYNWEQWAA